MVIHQQFISISFSVAIGEFKERFVKCDALKALSGYDGEKIEILASQSKDLSDILDVTRKSCQCLLDGK